MGNTEHIYLSPGTTESRSSHIIEAALTDYDIPESVRHVVKSVIQATADFEYAEILAFSDDVAVHAEQAFRDGCPVVTDTHMAKVGINANALARYGCYPHCHIADADVRVKSRVEDCTRSRAAVDKAVSIWGDAIFVIGNAPTALIRICELAAERLIAPPLVIGVPVGFVDAKESKDMLEESGIPYIVSRGPKGGSTVAAAIVNALLYGMSAWED